MTSRPFFFKSKEVGYSFLSVNSKIKNIFACELLDSRGQPALEVKLTLSCGAVGVAMVPSGASTGTHEALELRDADPKRFHGKGLLKACEIVNIHFQKLLKGRAAHQKDVDQLLIQQDGTSNKSRFGANAILGVSLALAKAMAQSQNKKLFEIFNPSKLTMPTPLINVINGGAHASNNVDVQEFMLVPLKAGSFTEALRKSSETFMCLKKLISDKGKSTSVGDEGGFAPMLSSNKEALDLLCEAIELADLTLGEDMGLALDVAASEFYHEGKYTWEKKPLDPEELLDVYKQWHRQYPIKSIEDPFAEDDWQNWCKITDSLKGTQIVGDDLFVTNPKRIQEGIEKKAANSVLIKVNQIGTLSETVEAIEMAKRASFTTVMSHRSGETEDVTIAHLSLGLETEQIKTGSVCRSDRVAKYNELMRIEQNFKEHTIFKGDKVFCRDH